MSYKLLPYMDWVCLRNYSAGGAGGADQDDQASQLLLYNNLSMPGSKNLEIIFFMVNFMKNFMKFLEIFLFGSWLKNVF